MEIWAGTRWPDFAFYFNGQCLAAQHTHLVHCEDGNKKMRFDFLVSLEDQNCFEVCMNDKSEAELFDPSIGFDKHWIKLHELEVDRIKFQDTFLKNCQITHDISDSWIQEKKRWGLDMTRTVYHTGELRLNGRISVRFDRPIWKWYCLQTQQI